MSTKVKKNILKLKESSTLVINEKSKELISQGKKVYQFGFGQSPFPVPQKIVETLNKMRTEKSIYQYKVYRNSEKKFQNTYLKKQEIFILRKIF